jgi:protein arginine N-methyltransferase 2
MEWACLAEQALQKADAAEALAKENEEYLASRVSYEDGKLLDSQGEAVMMQWEEPLMAAHANLICQNGGDILNVGFGMGIIDDAIQGCVRSLQASSLSKRF